MNTTNTTELDLLVDGLADKVEQAADLIERLRADNIALRERLASVEAARGHLEAQTKAAHERLSALLARIPDEVRA
ncbi:MAG: hypothetical protein LBR88_10695 [Zoogloeaceae bacterium]|nr:hypothetical protein [Zoogloeaceae bacterium]